MGWGMDLIAVDSYWMNTLTFAISKGGLAPFIGDSLASKAISPCSVVNMNEIIDQALRFADGFQLDDNEVALNEIAKAGPGGSFLSSPTTLKKYRTGYYPSHLYPRWNMEKWQSEGHPDARQILREKTQSMLVELTEPQDYKDLIGGGEEFIRNLRI
jgi:trimethylamine--corrinoid protein Co-methyltransferase